MSRGFKEIKKPIGGGKSEIARQNSYGYFIKTEKINSKIEEDAKKRFKAKPYGLGAKDENKSK